MAESKAPLPPTSIRITTDDFRLALDHLRTCYPLEGCGLLAGKEGRILRVYLVDNRLASPSAYEMDPQQQLEAMLDMEDREMELQAIFHSHPQGPDRPSTADLDVAFYPEAAYVIVSLRNPDKPSTRGFIIKGREVEEIPIIVD